MTITTITITITTITATSSCHFVLVYMEGRSGHTCKPQSFFLLGYVVPVRRCAAPRPAQSPAAMSVSDLIRDLGLDTRDGETRGWRMLLLAAGPGRVLQLHLEGKFLELVQHERPTLVYVNPSTDPKAYDIWQTPPEGGIGLFVGRPHTAPAEDAINTSGPSGSPAVSTSGI